MQSPIHSRPGPAVSRIQNISSPQRRSSSTELGVDVIVALKKDLNTASFEVREGAGTGTSSPKTTPVVKSVAKGQKKAGASPVASVRASKLKGSPPPGRGGVKKVAGAARGAAKSPPALDKTPQKQARALDLSGVSTLSSSISFIDELRNHNDCSADIQEVRVTLANWTADVPGALSLKERRVKNQELLKVLHSCVKDMQQIASHLERQGVTIPFKGKLESLEGEMEALWSSFKRNSVFGQVKPFLRDARALLNQLDEVKNNTPLAFVVDSYRDFRLHDLHDNLKKGSDPQKHIVYSTLHHHKSPNKAVKTGGQSSILYLSAAQVFLEGPLNHASKQFSVVKRADLDRFRDLGSNTVQGVHDAESAMEVVHFIAHALKTLPPEEPNRTDNLDRLAAFLDGLLEHPNDFLRQVMAHIRDLPVDDGTGRSLVDVARQVEGDTPIISDRLIQLGASSAIDRYARVISGLAQKALMYTLDQLSEMEGVPLNELPPRLTGIFESTLAHYIGESPETAGASAAVIETILNEMCSGISTFMVSMEQVMTDAESTVIAAVTEEFKGVSDMPVVTAVSQSSRDQLSASVAIISELYNTHQRSDIRVDVSTPLRGAIGNRSSFMQSVQQSIRQRINRGISEQDDAVTQVEEALKGKDVSQLGNRTLLVELSDLKVQIKGIEFELRVLEDDVRHRSGAANRMLPIPLSELFSARKREEIEVLRARLTIVTDQITTYETASAEQLNRAERLEGVRDLLFLSMNEAAEAYVQEQASAVDYRDMDPVWGRRKGQSDEDVQAKKEEYNARFESGLQDSLLQRVGAFKLDGISTLTPEEQQTVVDLWMTEAWASGGFFGQPLAMDYFGVQFAPTAMGVAQAQMAVTQQFEGALEALPMTCTDASLGLGAFGQDNEGVSTTAGRSLAALGRFNAGFEDDFSQLREAFSVAHFMHERDETLKATDTAFRQYRQGRANGLSSAIQQQYKRQLGEKVGGFVSGLLSESSGSVWEKNRLVADFKRICEVEYELLLEVVERGFSSAKEHRVGKMCVNALRVILDDALKGLPHFEDEEDDIPVLSSSSSLPDSLSDEDDQKSVTNSPLLFEYEEDEEEDDPDDDSTPRSDSSVVPILKIEEFEEEDDPDDDSTPRSDSSVVPILKIEEFEEEDDPDDDSTSRSDSSVVPILKIEEFEEEDDPDDDSTSDSEEHSIPILKVDEQTFPSNKKVDPPSNPIFTGNNIVIPKVEPPQAPKFQGVFSSVPLPPQGVESTDNEDNVGLDSTDPPQNPSYSKPTKRLYSLARLVLMRKVLYEAFSATVESVKGDSYEYHGRLEELGIHPFFALETIKEWTRQYYEEAQARYKEWQATQPKPVPAKASGPGAGQGATGSIGSTTVEDSMSTKSSPDDSSQRSYVSDASGHLTKAGSGDDKVSKSSDEKADSQIDEEEDVSDNISELTDDFLDELDPEDDGEDLYPWGREID